MATSSTCFRRVLSSFKVDINEDVLSFYLST